MSIACKPKSKVQAADRLVRSRRRSAPGVPTALPPPLTVIVPVYNEAATVSDLLRRVMAAPYHKQLMVVNDGSTDDTAQALDAWRRYPGFKVLRHATNPGNGAAIRTGLEHAEGQFRPCTTTIYRSLCQEARLFRKAGLLVRQLIVVRLLTIIQEADLEYNPEDYPKLLEPLLSGEASVVYGSRRLGHSTASRNLLNPFCHGVSLLDLCVRLWYGVWITDEATCYKAFRTDVLRWIQLECRRFELCPELTAKACRIGLRIKEVPIAYHARRLRQGKKIRFRDWAHAVFTLWRWRNWRPAAGWDRTSNHPCRTVTRRGSTRLKSAEGRDRVEGGLCLSGSLAAAPRTSCDAPRRAESVKRSEMR